MDDVENALVPWQVRVAVGSAVSSPRRSRGVAAVGGRRRAALIIVSGGGGSVPGLGAPVVAVPDAVGQRVAEVEGGRGRRARR